MARKIRFASVGENADLSTSDLVAAHKYNINNSTEYAQRMASIEASGKRVTVRAVDGSDVAYQNLAKQNAQGWDKNNPTAFAFTRTSPSGDSQVYISYQFLQKAKHQTGNPSTSPEKHTVNDALMHELGVHTYEKVNGLQDSPNHGLADQNLMRDQITGNTNPANHKTQDGANVNYPEGQIYVETPAGKQGLIDSAPGDGSARQGSPTMQDSDGNVLTAKQIKSPLVLDLDNDGVELVSMSSDDAVFFQFDPNSNFKVLSGWVSGGDGLLSLDLNADGIINDGGELFGNQNGADNGFLALAQHDSNFDGLITEEDQVWQDLKIWVDGNHNGYSDEGELYTLDALTITSIGLSYDNVDYDIAGNSIYQEGSFTMGGNSYDIVDAYFETTPFNSVYSADYTIDIEAELLMSMSGYGTLPDLNIAMSLDNNSSDPDSLISLVSAFSEMEIGGIFASDTVAMDGVRDIMYRWAEVDDVTPTSRGDYVDAREIGFLEAMTGQAFLQRDTYSNPLQQAGEELGRIFMEVHSHVYATLVTQTAAGDLFTGDFYYDFATDSFEEITGLNTAVLDDLETAAALLSTTLEKEELWSNVVRMVEYTVGVGNLDSTSLTALEDAIDAAGSDLTFLVDSLVETPAINEVDGTSGVDTLDGTGGRDVIDAGSDNDTLDGLAGIDELYGRNGDDTLIGNTGDDFLSGGSGADNQSDRSFRERSPASFWSELL